VRRLDAALIFRGLPVNDPSAVLAFYNSLSVFWVPHASRLLRSVEILTFSLLSSPARF
jgi:hypothetical protein